ITGAINRQYGVGVRHFGNGCIIMEADVVNLVKSDELRFGVNRFQARTQIVPAQYFAMSHQPLINHFKTHGYAGSNRLYRGWPQIGKKPGLWITYRIGKQLRAFGFWRYHLYL